MRALIELLKQADGDYAMRPHVIRDAIFGCDLESLIHAIDLEPGGFNLFDDFEYTPLHWAVLSYKEHHTKVLLDAGADVNIPTRKREETPLYLACQGQNWEIVHTLVYFGACVDLKTAFFGEVALMKVCARRRFVEALLDHGADILIKNKFGETVIHYLAKADEIKGNVKQLGEVLSLLSTYTDAGVDINGTRNDEVTAIRCLFNRMLTEGRRNIILTVAGFLEHGANPNIMDGKGRNIMPYLLFSLCGTELDSLDRRHFLSMDPDGTVKGRLGHRRTALEYLYDSLDGSYEPWYPNNWPPSMLEVVSFLDFLVDRREQNWDAGHFLETWGNFEKDGSHMLLKAWSRRERQRIARDAAYGNRVAGPKTLPTGNDGGEDDLDKQDFGDELQVPVGGEKVEEDEFFDAQETV